MYDNRILVLDLLFFDTPQYTRLKLFNYNLWRRSQSVREYGYIVFKLPGCMHSANGNMYILHVCQISSMYLCVGKKMPAKICFLGILKE